MCCCEDCTGGKGETAGGLLQEKTGSLAFCAFDELESDTLAGPFIRTATVLPSLALAGSKCKHQ